jgi:hypothetical protein
MNARPLAGASAAQGAQSAFPSRIEDLAHRLVRLAPSHRDPEAFHVEKHTVAAELRRLARDMRRVAA